MRTRAKTTILSLLTIFTIILLGFTAVPSHAVDTGSGSGGNSATPPGTSGGTPSLGTGSGGGQGTARPNSGNSQAVDPYYMDEPWAEGLNNEEALWLKVTHEKMENPVSLAALRAYAEHLTDMNLDIDDNTPVEAKDMVHVGKGYFFPWKAAPKRPSRNMTRWGIFQFSHSDWYPMCVKHEDGTLCKDENNNGEADNKDIATYTDLAADKIDALHESIGNAHKSAPHGITVEAKVGGAMLVHTHYPRPGFWDNAEKVQETINKYSGDEESD